MDWIIQRCVQWQTFKTDHQLMELLGVEEAPLRREKVCLPFSMCLFTELTERHWFRNYWCSSPVILLLWVIIWVSMGLQQTTSFKEENQKA